MKTIRQGDLLFVPVQNENAHPALGTRALGQAESFREDGIIKEGEATGHHHRVAVLEHAEVFRPSWSNATVRVGPNGVSIVHEEHATVTLAPNTTYVVHIAREFDYLAQANRDVMD